MMPRNPLQPEEEESITRLARTLNMLREKRGYSIREFAKLAGCAPSDIFRLETGKTKNPSVFLVEKIAKALDMSTDELMKFRAVKCPTCGGSGIVADTSP